MAQVADYTIANDSGANVRADLNNVFAAIQSLNSGSSDPAHSATVANMLVVNTTSNLLKIVNASNNGFITIGNVTQANLGLAPLAGATFTGKVTHNYTSSLNLPAGTTAQRDGSPAVGMFRYNSTLNVFEGYKNTGWGEIGGGAGATGGVTDEVFVETDQNVTTNYTLTANKHAHTVSPTINSGVTITVPSGAILVIL